MKRYNVRSDTILDDEGKCHTVYGVELPAERVSIPDIFCTKKEAEDFTEKCNALDLSPLHLRDVIDDLL